MADYLPLYAPGARPVITASADIVGGTVIGVSGSGTAATTTAATAAWIGVAAFDTKAGQPVTYFCGGVQRLTAVGTVNAGDIVVCAAAGGVATNAAPGAGQQVGVARTTAANGVLVEVQFLR